MTDKERFGPVRILISVLLHKSNNNEWTEKELQPIQSIQPLVNNLPVALGGLKIKLNNGKEYKVNFKNMDGTNSTW
jgi:hypothetical protein